MKMVPKQSTTIIMDKHKAIFISFLNIQAPKSLRHHIPNRMLQPKDSKILKLIINNYLQRLKWILPPHCFQLIRKIIFKESNIATNKRSTTSKTYTNHNIHKRSTIRKRDYMAKNGNKKQNRTPYIYIIHYQQIFSHDLCQSPLSEEPICLNLPYPSSVSSISPFPAS